MRNAVGCMLVMASCAGEPSTGSPPPMTSEDALEVRAFGENPGQVRLFLFAPTSPRPGAGLVVALHGCAQTAADFQKVGWNALAQAHGFYVLYAQASSTSGCFRWFEPGHANRGQGESASIVAGVRWVLARYEVDPRRVSVTGLSAGAAMTAALLASSPEVFSAGAIFAGVPVGCASNASEGVRCMAGVDLPPQRWADAVTSRWPVTPVPVPTPRVQVWSGDEDFTVSPSMADELVEQWTQVHRVNASGAQRETVRRVTSELYGPATSPLVQRISVSGFGHAVPVAVSRGCGVVGPYVHEADVCGALEAARFFGLIEPEVELLDAGPLPGVTPTDAGTGTVDGGVAQCRESVATPTWHVWLRHAEVCGFFGTLVCALGSQEVLGSTLSAVPVTASSVGDGVWRVGPCQ